MRKAIGAVLAMAMLAACSSQPQDAGQGATPKPGGSADQADGLRSCVRAQPARAIALAAVCRGTPGADPRRCRPLASCAAVRQETARACALLDDAAAKRAGCNPPPRSDKAAAAVVTRYYAAIAAHDYSTAWAEWGADGQPGRSFDDFARGYAETRDAGVVVTGPVEREAAMGSVYATVPVRVTALLAGGRRQVFTGRYVVRRVNNVDGATPAQLRWHIDSARLIAGS